MVDRQAAMKLQNFKKPSDKSLWEQLLKIDYMSSEESDVDGDEDVLEVHDLPWRKPSVKKMFATLDAESLKRKSAQAKRQMKCREGLDETSASFNSQMGNETELTEPELLNIAD